MIDLLADDDSSSSIIYGKINNILCTESGMLMVEHKHTRINVISRTRLSDSLILSRSPCLARTHTQPI